METLEQWTTMVQERTGIPASNSARYVMFAVLDALGEMLTADEAELLARHLPEELAGLVREAAARRAPKPSPGLSQLVNAVKWREKGPPGAAVEHVTAVCDVLAEQLDEDTIMRLRADLPEPLGALLLRRRRTGHVAVPDHERRDAPPERPTLATGHAGSSHPLADAKPDRAHSESVARSDSPHEETKMASASGSTQERLGDALANASPGPPRRISGG